MMKQKAATKIYICLLFLLSNILFSSLLNFDPSPSIVYSLFSLLATVVLCTAIAVALNLFKLKIQDGML